MILSKLRRNGKLILAIIGPEAPLEKGLADALWEHAIPTIGPKKQLAQIETSKAFARDLHKKISYTRIRISSHLHDLARRKRIFA